MYDWTETSIDHIREADFPIRCERCDHDLTGLGESGICPACGVSFSRRQRLWHTYGPEAFAKPPITPAEQDAQRKDTGFLSGLLAGIVVTLFLIVLLILAVSGTVDLCFCLFVWVVVVSASVWLMVVRHAGKAKPEADVRKAADK